MFVGLENVNVNEQVGVKAASRPKLESGKWAKVTREGRYWTFFNLL